MHLIFKYKGTNQSKRNLYKAFRLYTQLFGRIHVSSNNFQINQLVKTCTNESITHSNTVESWSALHILIELWLITSRIYEDRESYINLDARACIHEAGCIYQSLLTRNSEFYNGPNPINRGTSHSQDRLVYSKSITSKSSKLKESDGLVNQYAQYDLVRPLLRRILIKIAFEVN